MRPTFAQLEFARGVAFGLSYSEAARRAYPRMADSAHYGWMSAQQPEVQILIMECRAGLHKAAEDHAITAERIIKELAAVAFARLGDVVAWDGDDVTVKASETLTEAQHAAVESVQAAHSAHGSTIKVKQHSKLDALEKLARIFNVYPDKDQGAGEHKFVILAPAPVADTATWLKTVEAEQARQRAVDVIEDSKERG